MTAIFFADNSNLLAEGNSLMKVEQLIKRDIPILIDWLHTNCLSLNIKKTHIMVFGPHQNLKKDSYTIDIKIEGEQLEIVHQTKFLG
jgi:hypothetical protein